MLLRYVLAAAAAQDDDRDKDNNPAIVVAEERIKAAHCKSSLHYLKIMHLSKKVLTVDSSDFIFYNTCVIKKRKISKTKFSSFVFYIELPATYAVENAICRLKPPV